MTGPSLNRAHCMYITIIVPLFGRLYPWWCGAVQRTFHALLRRPGRHRRPFHAVQCFARVVHHPCGRCVFSGANPIATGAGNIAAQWAIVFLAVRTGAEALPDLGYFLLAVRR